MTKMILLFLAAILVATPALAQRAGSVRDTKPFEKFNLKDDQFCLIYGTGDERSVEENRRGIKNRVAVWILSFSKPLPSLVVAVYSKLTIDPPAMQPQLTGIYSAEGTKARPENNDFIATIPQVESNRVMMYIGAFVQNANQWQALFRWPNDGDNNRSPQFGAVKGQPSFLISVGGIDRDCVQ